MTVDEVATHMQVSKAFVREAIKQGKIRGAFYINHKDRCVYYVDRDEFLGKGRDDEKYVN